MELPMGKCLPGFSVQQLVSQHVQQSNYRWLLLGVALSDTDYIFLPYYYNHNHWTLFVFRPNEELFTYYDPLGNQPDAEVYEASKLMAQFIAAPAISHHMFPLCACAQRAPLF